MKSRLLALAALACVGGGASHAMAYGPYVSYYAPMTAYYAPAPATYVVASPVVTAAPAPVVAYYPTPSVAYQPTAQVVTRFRPLLGGTVSRVRYGYAPVVYYP